VTGFLRDFFQLNQTVILFVYGLVFFVLGLAIALHSRSYSRLDLARSLGWLAAFGLAHGLHEWGDIFIPIQATYLSAPFVQVLQIVQVLLLAVSFVCLLQFGVATLRPLRQQQRWLALLPAALLGVWTIAFITPSFHVGHDLDARLRQGGILARYLLGFPGGLLAAYGLRQQAFTRIAPLGLPFIVSTLRVAGFALVVYAFVAGLIGPPGDFFPANVLNHETVVALIGIPPEVLRSVIGLVLTVAVIRVLEVFDLEVERRIEKMERTQVVALERERIGRELHDSVIQTIYSAGLMVETARRQLDGASPLAMTLEQAMMVLNAAIHDLRRFIFELRPERELTDLAEGLRQLAEDARLRSLVEVSLEMDLPEQASMAPARTGHVLAITGEALSNVARHSRARRADVRAWSDNGRLHLTIRDDGVGFAPGSAAVERDAGGMGLGNMRDRARMLGGNLSVESQPGRGTTVALDMPWEESG
jgi:signal transduction histidine kinase